MHQSKKKDLHLGEAEVTMHCSQFLEVSSSWEALKLPEQACVFLHYSVISDPETRDLKPGDNSYCITGNGALNWNTI